MILSVSKSVTDYRLDAAVTFLRAAVLGIALQFRSAAAEVRLARAFLQDAQLRHASNKLREMTRTGLPSAG